MWFGIKKRSKTRDRVLKSHKNMADSLEETIINTTPFLPPAGAVRPVSILWGKRPIPTTDDSIKEFADICLR
jgi:hypothetical protein